MDGQATSETTLLRVGTFNVDNLKSNACYVLELLEKCDVLLLQEHWLHRYEVNLIESLLPNYNYEVKCFDDDSLLPPLHGTTGRAGVMGIIKWCESSIEHKLIYQY